MDRAKSWTDASETEGAPKDAASATGDQDSLQLIALRYAANRFRVFPCGADKAPLIKDNLRRATGAGGIIIHWWAKWPDALVGLPCEENQLVVLDFDLYKPGVDNAAADL